MMQQSAYHALMRRVTEVLDGEPLENAAFVCAAVVSYAILQSPTARRAELRAELVAFIDGLTEDTPSQSELN